MNLEQAIKYRNDKVALGFKSDGCTYVPDFGIKEWCVMHDVLLVHKPVSRLRADNLFFKGIASEGLRYYPIAVIYYLAVRIFTLFE